MSEAEVGHLDDFCVFEDDLVEEGGGKAALACEIPSTTTPLVSSLPSRFLDELIDTILVSALLLTVLDFGQPF